MREGGVLWSVMYCSGEKKQWSCGKAGTVNFQKVGSLMRDIGDPCLSYSPVKVVISVRLSNHGRYWVYMQFVALATILSRDY